MKKNSSEEGTATPHLNESGSNKPVFNPFEDSRSVDQDIELAKEEMEKEQEFKEAQSERD